MSVSFGTGHVRPFVIPFCRRFILRIVCMHMRERALECQLSTGCASQIVATSRVNGNHHAQISVSLASGQFVNSDIYQNVSRSTRKRGVSTIPFSRIVCRLFQTVFNLFHFFQPGHCPSMSFSSLRRHLHLDFSSNDDLYLNDGRFGRILFYFKVAAMRKHIEIVYCVHVTFTWIRNSVIFFFGALVFVCLSIWVSLKYAPSVHRAATNTQDRAMFSVRFSDLLTNACLCQHWMDGHFVA